jgi:hypothetical protein
VALQKSRGLGHLSWGRPHRSKYYFGLFDGAISVLLHHNGYSGHRKIHAFAHTEFLVSPGSPLARSWDPDFYQYFVGLQNVGLLPSPGEELG